MTNEERQAVLALRLRASSTAPAPVRISTSELRKVVNKRWYAGSLPADVFYIGRRSKADPGPYGNPFEIGVHGTRDDVCDAFEIEFRKRLERPAYVEQMMRDLDGKHLCCWCKSHTAFMRCHGDTILREVAKRTRFSALYCS
jgi:hypothetical protein